MRWAGAVLLVVLACPGFLAAQATTTTPTTTPATAAPTAPVFTPKDYSPEEFQPWMLELRRAEILAIGAFPVTYLFANLGFDYGYYVATGFPSGNIPWPLGPGTSGWTSSSQGAQLQQKNWTLVGVSLGLSVAVAVADWVLGKL